jgi:hypothetical protein
VHRWSSSTDDGVSHPKPPKANRMLLLRTHNIFFLLIGSSSRLPQLYPSHHPLTTIITLILYLSFGGWGGRRGELTVLSFPSFHSFPLRFLSLLLSISALPCPLLFFLEPLEISFDGRRSEGASLFLFVPCRVSRSIQSNHFFSSASVSPIQPPGINLARSSRRLWGNISPHQEPR